MMEVQAAEELYQEYCNFIFDYVDKDGSGKISKSELKYDVYHWFIHSCKLFHALFSPQKTLLNWCLLLKNINHDRAQKITDSNESDCRKTFVLSVISFIFLVKTVFIFFAFSIKLWFFESFVQQKAPGWLFWILSLRTSLFVSKSNLKYISLFEYPGWPSMDILVRSWQILSRSKNNLG